MRCNMCDSWKKDFGDEMTTDEIRSILSQLPKMDFVRLSGGEHFLRGDLLDIAHATQATFKPIGLPTCQFNSTSIGNLRRKNFASIWFGNPVAKQRQWINNCPGCWTEREILPNEFYSADIAGWIRNYHNVNLPMSFQSV